MSQFDIYEKIVEEAKDGKNIYFYISNYIINHIQEIYNMNIKEFATNTFTSVATIHRFIKYLNLESYKEMKYILKNVSETRLGESGISDSNNNDIVENIHKQLVKTIDQTASLLHQQQEKIITISKQIIKCNRIILVGFGGTYNVARDFYNKLQRLGIICNISQDIHNLSFLSRLLGKNDIIFIVSYSGVTEEILRLLKLLKNDESSNKPQIISITKNVDNPVQQSSDINLVVQSNESTIRHTSLTSRTAILFAIDCIYSSIINEDKEKYSRILKFTEVEK
ncbi:GntR family transcriptional regulator [Spiroplasma clarkii]|uniref:MurR/RpiR family transcriptional regulator n=1 Tax=Spiroplasma clarkii TaxID=2139 RepID=A0A1Y0L2B2_9MOLU|nr:MurR/RpiR family transcriptional regulator [Spiroplasma clarkii]ARU91858.1 GntR family transcriptional regulator [Spiroplasma clarkii]ATX71211.1 MurR/RpiR family transcriptional regulator [Spiroplasma clarkii]